MKRKQSTIIAGIVVAVVGGLLLLVIGQPVKEFITLPETVPVAQYNERVCPANFYNFNSANNNVFSIKLNNIGDDGILFVKLSSDKILSTADKFESFAINSTKNWIVENGKEADFAFEIKMNKSITDWNNFTIYFDYGCYKKVGNLIHNCQQYTRCCNYKLNYPGSDNYNLVNDTC